MVYHKVKDGVCCICGPTETWVRQGKVRCKNTNEYKNRRKATNSARNGNGKYAYRKYKLGKTKCDWCGFIAAHPCQLDVDHFDGDKTNGEQTNLWVLCANCHRLKTVWNKDRGATGRTNLDPVVMLVSENVHVEPKQSNVVELFWRYGEQDNSFGKSWFKYTSYGN